MISIDKRALRGTLALATIVLISVLAFPRATRCQVSDGDEQFQAYHQDIGRISASQPSRVAAETVVRHSSPQVEALEATTPVAQPARQTVVERPAASAPPTRQAALDRLRGPKRNRVTLAVARPERERDPLLTHIADPPARQASTLIETSHDQQASSHLVSPPSQPSYTLTQATYQPSQPTTLSPRPSALMSQVAAERSMSQNYHQQYQPSLGSPMEALSSPSIAQVQAPPTLTATSVYSQATSASQPQNQFINQPEEPEVAPSFEQVMGRGCPSKGVFSYENKDHCDRYYMCTNGTLTEEACPNGLAYSQMGAVYQHCAYNWNVDCGRKTVAEPLASPGCPWQFGIFPIAAAGKCSIDYFVCEWGVPETKRCSPEGLFYDDRIKGCQWADQLGCKSEALLNFKCPSEDEDNPYWPFPRYYHTNKDIIVCVNEQPRLVHCTEDQLVDSSSLACLDLKKKKKKLVST